MTEHHRIVVIEDDPQLRRFLKTGLEVHGFRVFQAISGKEGIAEIVKNGPDLILLDLGLQDMDGKEIIEEVKAWSKIPIIVLSARFQVDEKVAALNAGANDYLTKPFDMRELLARINAVLRQTVIPAGGTPVIRSGHIVIDLVRRVVTADGVEVHLSPREYSLLQVLASNPDMVLTHEMLISSVWDGKDLDNVNYLRIFVGRLRHKLETDPARPRIIVTETGVGYRMRILPPG
ncbi:MAG: response regulator [Rhodospirillales bacterium]|nr:MAG: response regulator [Rhodospirillales bacterium]